MKRKIFLAYILILASLTAFAQKKKSNDPILELYKLLSSESVYVKDSLAIYALNFELVITKKNGKTVVANISANDSLAFSLFPSYKKISAIDFSQLMGVRKKNKLIIPILIYGSSPEKMIYKDKYGNPLISLNAAVNAAHALYNPFKYNNIKDSGVLLGHLQFKASRGGKLKVTSWEAITLEPINIVISNIK